MAQRGHPRPNPRHPHGYRDPDDALKPEAWFTEFTRDEATEELYKLERECSFVVRPSSDRHPDQPYSLSIYHNEEVKHIMLSYQDGGFFIGSKKGSKTFASVTELITYHTRYPMRVDSDELTLNELDYELTPTAPVVSPPATRNSSSRPPPPSWDPPPVPGSTPKPGLRTPQTPHNGPKPGLRNELNDAINKKKTSNGDVRPQLPPLPPPPSLPPLPTPPSAARSKQSPGQQLGQPRPTPPTNPHYRRASSVSGAPHGPKSS